MIKTGEYQTLSISREMPQGLYLSDNEENEVLLPRSQVTDEMKIDDTIEVFVYRDSSDLEIATTIRPYLTLGQFACLKVIDVNQFGAFCDWGLSKDLFVPFRNQHTKLELNQYVIIYLYLDKITDRLVGTTKISGHLKKTADDQLVFGQEVDLLVQNETILGYTVIINQEYLGLVYKNETSMPLKTGAQFKGYIKPIRSDGKIDVSLYPIGFKSIEPNAKIIFDKLKNNDGFLPFTDKSDPALIKDEFGISKKLFKKSLGALYKHKLIQLKEDGIHLC